MSTPPPAPRSSTRSRGRGAAAAFGFLLLFAGLIGGGVLYVMSLQRHDKAVESFARAVVGCTTTLEFSETGTFFVYAETAGSFEIPEGGCQPSATPGAAFEVALDGPQAVTLVDDTSIDYDTDEFTGSSVGRFEIVLAGNYEIEVSGGDQSVRAAIGRDPSSGVDELRRGALVVAAAGVLLGGLLLALAGRRSRRAATPSIPDGPGWGHRPGEGATSAWPPAPPRIPQVPVNPHQPDTPAAVAAPPPPLPARAPGSGSAARSPWAPPTADAEPVDTAPPERVDKVKPPELPPQLPR